MGSCFSRIAAIAAETGVEFTRNSFDVSGTV
jgi:hypothetical protein